MGRAFFLGAYKWTSRRLSLLSVSENGLSEADCDLKPIDTSLKKRQFYPNLTKESVHWLSMITIEGALSVKAYLRITYHLPVFGWLYVYCSNWPIHSANSEHQ